MSKSVEYRIVPGFPAYMVGDDGSIWSCLRSCGNRWEMSGTWRELKPTAKTDDYLKVCLSIGDGSKRWKTKVHLVVLLAFKGPRPKGLEGCHKDGNHHNNSLDNLYYGTHQENMDDRGRHGKTQCGERHFKAKLTEQDVHAIRRMAWRISSTRVAEMYGVASQSILGIWNGIYWKQLPHE